MKDIIINIFLLLIFLITLKLLFFRKRFKNPSPSPASRQPPPAETANSPHPSRPLAETWPYFLPPHPRHQKRHRFREPFPLHPDQVSRLEQHHALSSILRRPLAQSATRDPLHSPPQLLFGNPKRRDTQATPKPGYGF